MHRSVLGEYVTAQFTRDFVETGVLDCLHIFSFKSVRDCVRALSKKRLENLISFSLYFK